MNVTCHFCEMENAYLDIVDEKGSHYICPDCEHEWCDNSNKAEAGEELFDDEDDDEKLKHYKECPNCFKKDFRFLYNCNLCGFTGCFDELYDKSGCFIDKTDKVNCPVCGKWDYEIIGKVGEDNGRNQDFKFDYK